MKTLGNIIWFIITGFVTWAVWVFYGLILYITIIGIPFGRQCFKLAKLSLFPFGREVRTNFDKHPIGNTIWILIFGWSLALGYVIAGIFYCITIIGIPFGKQCFKLMRLSFTPMGATVR